jgi:ATP adenylyltransferase
MPSTKFVDIDNSRKEDQRQVMQEIVNQDHCPFCAENLNKYHKQPILKETKHWILTKNQWPYDNTKIHLLGIIKEHKEKLSELTPEMGTELFEIISWAEKEFEMPGGGFAMRFGDTEFSAATVKHLHIQLLVPDIESPHYEPTRIKIGKSRKNK